MAEKKKLANLELLRCLAMMMVIVLHYLGKGGLLTPLQEDFTATGYVAWLLEALCIVAVNLYMLISGYLLCESNFKLSRLLGMWLQLEFYSVTVGVISALAGVVQETPVDTHYYLTLLFPVSMGHYWFMTAYIFLYIMLPLVGLAVKRMTKGQLQTAICLLLVTFCLLKSILPLRLDMDQRGYDCLWYLTLFLCAAYIRKYGLAFPKNRGVAFGLYVCMAVLIFGETMLFRQVYLRTGSLERVLNISYEYNHLLPFLASVFFFVIFIRTEVAGGLGKAATALGPLTLGVYLLHENLGLRYTWQEWFKASEVSSIPALLGTTVLAVAVIFTAGILVERIRKSVFALGDRILRKIPPYDKLRNKIQAVDSLFKN